MLGLAIALAAISLNAAKASPPEAAVQTGAPTRDARATVLQQLLRGRWTGQTDWIGADDFDNALTWWEFGSDGTFRDANGDTGPWTLDADGYVSFTYSTSGRATYRGTIVGGTLLGTMTTANGQYRGVFAARR